MKSMLKKIFFKLLGERKKDYIRVILSGIFCISVVFFSTSVGSSLVYISNNVVEECRGCGKCFDEGLCPQDQEDSMEYIRKKILEADLIVLLSPVYLNNVSGAMKTFLDRIGSWVHTLRKRA